MKCSLTLVRITKSNKTYDSRSLQGSKKMSTHTFKSEMIMGKKPRWATADEYIMNMVPHLHNGVLFSHKDKLNYEIWR